ncbi:hypothetical protein DKX38_007483 [Salix brachista]|uniref:shikimate kinase n=1 Tax=Salix brachista TaxID=2182728 RepID=A0A5N5MNB4_9ROSI|nr:hypothetical protein DKX38_007483 [Salix brachista]
MQLSTTWIDTSKFARKPTGFLRFSGILKEQKRLQVFVSAQFRPLISENGFETFLGSVTVYGFNQFSTSESESLQDLLDDEALILKARNASILTWMMGSGKTTEGKILSQAIDYSFCDSDTLVEQDVGVTAVAEIFQIYGEHFFRDKETKALEKLSGVHRYVVSTGGGAVIRDENWTHMGKGISVWLDVPLEELARRIAAVGTKTRPLLVNEQGDAYTKAFRRLSALFEQRYKAYENASARVSLENKRSHYADIAAKLGYKDVSNITPAMIAIELDCFSCHLAAGFRLLPAGFGMQMMCRIGFAELNCAIWQVPLDHMPCDQIKFVTQMKKQDSGY